MNKDLWQRRIRNYAGFLGAVLPWLSVLGAVLVQCHTPLGHGFWADLSISATYYITPALAGILTTASVVLMTYDGYDLQDNIVTTISGVFGIMIVLFPCNCSIAPAYVGFFQLPVKVSSAIHCTAAVIFFLLLAYNALFLFTKHGDEMTAQKKKRNKVYVICGIGMIVSMALMPMPIHFPAKTWIVEMLALSFFGVSWLVKGDAFLYLRDNDK